MVNRAVYIKIRTEQFNTLLNRPRVSSYRTGQFKTVARAARGKRQLEFRETPSTFLRGDLLLMADGTSWIARESSKEWDHMSTTEAKRTDNGEIGDLDVIIVGAGFAGLYLLDRLHGMGMAVQVFEAGALLAVSGIGIVSWGPCRFSRSSLSIFARRPVAEMAVQRTLSVMAGDPRVFPLR
jgi:hypothetical protein